MQLNIFETEDSIITVDIAKKPFYYGVDAISQFRKLELSCLRALSFISLVALILFISITNVYSAQVTLMWEPNTEPDFAGNKIYYGPSSRNYDSVYDVGNQTSYTIQNLVEGQTYYIAVTAYNTFNTESDYSVELVYTVPILDLTATMAMTSPAPDTELTTETVNFQWSAGNGVDSYWLGVGTSYESISNNPWGNIYTQSTGTNTSTTVTGIPLNGNTVYVRLWSETRGFWSFEDYTYGTPTDPILDLTVPSTPTSLQSTTISTSQINLSWNASSDNIGVTGYKIYRGSTLIATTSNTTYQDTGLSPSTTYSYIVSAYDAAGNESGQVSTSSVTTTVVNINRPPVLDTIANITVSEGVTITLNPTATDPDGDALTYTYSGWMSSASYTTTYDDAGTHTVTVTVSDGSLSDSQVVTVIVNDTTPIVEKTITAGDIDGNGQEDIIIDYGTGIGIWTLMNDSTWMQLHTLSPETMTTGDMDGNGLDEVILDGGDLYGIWIFMNNSTWAKLHDVSPEIITTGDIDGNGQDEVIVDFGDPYGISVLVNNSTWMQLHTLSPETMTTGDIDGNGQDEVIVDGGDLYGISVLMNNSTWMQLHTLSPETMTTGDIDGNGQDEVIVNGGDLYGISVLMNNSTWMQLHTLSPETMTTGDIDRNGQDEVILDGGDLYGIWIFMNNSTWAKLHDVSPEIIETGDMDGNGLDEVIIDFGDPYGISVLMNNSAWKSLAMN